MSSNPLPNIGGNGTTDGPKPVTAETINDIFSELDKEDAAKGLNVDDDDLPEPKKAKSKVSDDDEDADDDLELVEPEGDDEKIDLLKKEDDLDIDAPPKKQQILKKYPELFKDFPFMEKMLYRDKQYNELFGSFDDAKEAHAAAENFKNFEQQLMSGDTKTILKEVKESDEKAFNIIVDDYLPNLLAVDKEAYFHVVGNLNKRLIMEMVSEAAKSGNEDLKTAALMVNQFIFGNSEFKPPMDRVDRTIDEKETKIEEERLKFVQERFETVRDDLQVRADNTLKATISEYIDPKGQMSSYTKKNAINDAMKNLSADIAKDPAFAKTLDKHWRDAFDNRFSRDTQERILRAYLGRAKGSLRDAILKARSEALKDTNTSAKKVEKDDDDEEVRTPRNRGLTSPGRTSQPKSKNEMKRGESVSEFFARD